MRTKIILTVLGLFFVVSIISAQDKKDLYTINKQKINIEFTTDYQFDDLAKIKSALEKLDINIVFTSLQFDERGYLKQISASIQYPDGESGSFVSRELKAEDRPGFRRNFDS